jgi:hypothetical protein
VRYDFSEVEQKRQTKKPIPQIKYLKNTQVKGLFEKYHSILKLKNFNDFEMI